MGLQHPFTFYFDDYTNGPTLEVLAPIHDTVMHYDASLVYLANQVTINPWPLFKDYGYRILPNFAQNYYLGKPKLIKEHLCPVGLPFPPSSITSYHQSEPEARLGQDIKVTDQVVMGLQDLMHQADAFGDEVLLTGKTGDECFVVLDLQQDRVRPASLTYSCDIDSLIWITRTPRFTAPCSISSGPKIRAKAPISKDNHVTVKLLFPQSAEDRARGGVREEWWTKPCPLSTIPHILFGTIPGPTVVEILLFFPRMKHRDPHRRFWRTQVPSEIQGQLWDRVVLPVLHKVVPDAMSALYPADRHHAQFKQGKKKSRIIELVLQPEHWTKVVEEMTHHVSVMIYSAVLV